MEAGVELAVEIEVVLLVLDVAGVVVLDHVVDLTVVVEIDLLAHHRLDGRALLVPLDDVLPNVGLAVLVEVELRDLLPRRVTGGAVHGRNPQVLRRAPSHHRLGGGLDALLLAPATRDQQDPK